MRPEKMRIETGKEGLNKKREELMALKKELDSELKEAGRTKDLGGVKKLKTKIKERMTAPREQLPAKEIKASWQNPETLEKKEITLNLKEELKYFKEFYQKNLGLELTKEQEKGIEKIWKENKKEIKKEMETYGYDTLLIVPDNLPDLETLNQKLIETMEEPQKGRVEQTFLGNDFKKGDGFKGVKNTEKQKLRIVLTIGDQNIYETENPFLKATLGKNIMQLTGLSEEDVKKRIQNRESLPIDFEATINNKKTRIQAEGLSLEEYPLFQRKYFDQNKKHLDENGWTWLLKSLSASRVVHSSWYPGRRQFRVYASTPGRSSVPLGDRLSRSFSV